ncbi:MAG TPA: acyltransferase [Polyangiaceae bacterium]|nr:acyltransferase [Polyangiaceae bacterium]
MSMPGSGFVRGWRDRLQGAATAFWLRDATSVGARAGVVGRPQIENSGSLRIGDDFQLRSLPTVSHVFVMPGGAVDIGHRVVISYGAAISCQAAIQIGDDVQLGPFVVIMDSDFHVAGDRHALAKPAPVRIGHRVSIGSRVTILRGSEIGDGARIASGSVVSGHVPAGATVAGVPARPVSRESNGETDVPRLVMRVLGLASVPAPHQGPGDIPSWDSLGSLKLLLALEEAFGVSFDEDELKSARSVARLAEIAEAARSRSGQRSTARG